MYLEKNKMSCNLELNGGSTWYYTICVLNFSLLCMFMFVLLGVHRSDFGTDMDDYEWTSNTMELMRTRK